MSLQAKNLWGAQGAQMEPQRTDLFRFNISLPDVLGRRFDNEIAFAVERFPFPDRAQQTFPMKFLNQTNMILGADQAPSPIEVPVRYAFTRSTADLLYRWHALASNPKTGATARTGDLKSLGHFCWLIPQKLSADNTDGGLVQGLTYRLEGCMPLNVKPTDANANEGNSYVTLTFRLSIDRYYPEPGGPMQFD